MNHLKSISFTNYRAFQKDQSIQLKPVTILFGHNSAGKSAALRLLPIISESTTRRNARREVPAVFPHASAALRGAAFEEMVCAKNPTGPIVIGLDGEDKSYSFQVRTGDRADGEVVSQFVYLDGEDTVAGILGGEPGSRIYDLYDGDRGELHKQVHLDGLWPAKIQEPTDLITRFISGAHSLLEAVAGRVYWLQSTRALPPRVYNFGPGTELELKSDGSGVAEVLRASYLSGDGVYESVSNWLKKACGAELAFAEMDQQASSSPNTYRFALRPEGGTAFIAVQDVGEGIAQSLPIVTLCHQAKAGLLGERPILALEQPELHLHPNAEVHLAGEILSCISSGSSACHVIETHSESILLSVQSAIALGQIEPDDVAVYWVQQNDGSSNLVEISFDKSGYPSEQWPIGVFREKLSQARELHKIRSGTDHAA